MNTQLKLIICAGAMIGLLDLAIGAENAPGTVDPGSVAAPRDADSQAAADEALRKRVQDALLANRYVNVRHVTVSVEKGHVILKGFVYNDWDLRDTLKIARTAAGDVPVVNDLSIKTGTLR